MINDWRFLKKGRSKTAHLWRPIKMTSSFYTQCGMLGVANLLRDTHPLTGEESLIRKCKKCISFEIRRKESA